MDTAGLMDTVHDAVRQAYPDMLDSVSRIRQSGLKAALLTNNWYTDKGEMESNKTMIDTTLAPLFDVVSQIII